VSSTYNYCIRSLLINILAPGMRIKENLKRQNVQKTRDRVILERDKDIDERIRPDLPKGRGKFDW
jgi:hypothetical protein